MWENYLNLANDETLVKISQKQIGHQLQTDVTNYLIRNSLNETMGSVEYTEDTSTKKPFKTRFSVKQKNTHGIIVVNESWE